MEVLTFNLVLYTCSNMKKLLFVLCTLLFLQGSIAQKSIGLRSPDNKLSCIIKTGKEGVKYQVAYNKTILVDYSLLSLRFGDGFALDNTIPMKAVYRDSVERYELLTGRSRQVESTYREVLIPFHDKNKSGKVINIIFRAFDDGIAFRYQITNKNSDSF